MTVTEQREYLNSVLLEPDPTDALWHFYRSGDASTIVPELAALELEQDPIHRHKDVLAHTIAVTAKTRPDVVLRLAALFHDIGKPDTRSFEHGGVTFRHHEAVGAKITRRRLRALGYDPQLVKDVAELVRLSGRFKGYGDGWSDSAVRRYARDAGHLFGLLNELVRADCTTRNRAKEARLHELIDDMERRVVVLAREAQRAAERPPLDGKAVMELLDLPPGPAIGQALAALLEHQRRDGELSVSEAEAWLRRWWDEQPGDPAVQ